MDSSVRAETPQGRSRGRGSVRAADAETFHFERQGFVVQRAVHSRRAKHAGSEHPPQASQLH